MSTNAPKPFSLSQSCMFAIIHFFPRFFCLWERTHTTVTCNGHFLTRCASIVVFWSLRFGYRVVWCFALFHLLFTNRLVTCDLFAHCCWPKNVPHPYLTNWFLANRFFRCLSGWSDAVQRVEVRVSERKRVKWTQILDQLIPIDMMRLPHVNCHISLPIKRNKSLRGGKIVAKMEMAMPVRRLFISNTQLQEHTVTGVHSYRISIIFSIVSTIFLEKN